MMTADQVAAHLARHYGEVSGIACEIDAVPDGVVVYVAERRHARELAEKIAGRLRVGGGRVELSAAPQLDAEQPQHLQWWFACFFDWASVLSE